MNRRQRQMAILSIYVATTMLLLGAFFFEILPAALVLALNAGGWLVWYRGSKAVPVDRPARKDDVG